MQECRKFRYFAFRYLAINFNFLILPCQITYDMPTAKNNVITKGLSGMVGKQVVFVKETKGKREYMRNRPFSQSKTKHNPVVHIQAVNLIRLKKVSVNVNNMDGKVLERGEAVMSKTITNWKYTCSVVTNPIPEIIVQVVAKDFPGNDTHASKHFIQGKKEGIPIPEKIAVRRVIHK